MGKPTGFLEVDRQDRGYVDPQTRLRNWKEFVHPLPVADLTKQAPIRHFETPARALRAAVRETHHRLGSSYGVSKGRQ